MKKLIVKDKFNIMGRGLVYCLSLQENGIGQLRKEFSKELMGKNVEIDNKTFLIKGIEAFATGEDYVHDSIGILVKEI